MTDQEDLDALAGEYVLGTLDHHERRQVERARLGDSGLDMAITAWENRLAPLVLLTPDITPPVDLFAAISAQLGAVDASLAPRVSAEIISLKARVRRWQVGAIASGLLAASLAGVIVLGPRLIAQQQTQFVAVLQKDSVSPAFVVSVDISTRQLTVRQVAADKLTGKSYELWLVNASLPQPRSLGLVRDAGVTRGVTLAAYSPEVVESSVLAVSLEPEGGSPTGLPTGPVVFTGKLLQTTP